MRPGKSVASEGDSYFPGDHGLYGTDADHVPIIPGNDFAPDGSNTGGFRLQNPVSR